MASAGQASCDLAGEIVILELDSGIYYGLDAVGTHIWRMLREPRTVEAVRDALVAEYDVTPATCQGELLALLEDMLGAGLIEVCDGRTG